MKYYKELLENRIADWTRYRKYLLAGLLGLLVADIAIVIVKQKWSVAGNEMEYCSGIIIVQLLVLLWRFWSGILSYAEHKAIVKEEMESE